MSLASIVLRRPYILRPTAYLTPSSSASLSTTATARKASKPLTVKKEFVSICAAGTPFTRIALFKDLPTPTAMKDEDYPNWLWTLLDQPKQLDQGKVPKQQVKEGGVMDFAQEKQRLRQLNKAAIKERNFLKSSA